MDANRFTLMELLVLMTFAAISCMVSSRGGPGLATCLFLTVVCFRTALVDFTRVGELATFLTMLFGFWTVMLMVCWTLLNS